MKIKAAIYTLGCKVNQYESEAIAEYLENNGAEICHGVSDADVCIINTCTVTAESDRKCRQIIRRAKKQNPGAVILVTGCYSQVSPDEIKKIEGVDYISGNGSKLEVAKKALMLAGNKQSCPLCEINDLSAIPFENISAGKSERTRAYIKIEDGCQNKCSYCIIPRARGNVRSKEFESIMTEAEKLSENGYHELVLTGIEVCAYGKDLRDNKTLPDVMKAIDEKNFFDRIRLGSMDPSYIKPAFTDKICNLKSTAPHFHLSLQSGCDKTLFAMKRRNNTAMVREYVEYMRTKIPNVEFTADIIVGFPGETEEDFETTCNFVKEIGLFDAHVFAYSKRKDTVAAEMKEQVDEQTKSRRSEILISICKELKKNKLEKYAKDGGVFSVLFETGGEGKAVGRLANFIEIEVPCQNDVSNQIHNVRITGISGERLTGEFAE